MGLVRSLGFSEIEQIAQILSVHGGRNPSRYVTYKTVATKQDPLRQVLSVCHAGIIKTDLEVNGRTFVLLCARHRRVGEKESKIDFTRLTDSRAKTLRYAG